MIHLVWSATPIARKRKEKINQDVNDEKAASLTSVPCYSMQWCPPASGGPHWQLLDSG